MTTPSSHCSHTRGPEARPFVGVVSDYIIIRCSLNQSLASVGQGNSSDVPRLVRLDCWRLLITAKQSSSIFPMSEDQSSWEAWLRYLGKLLQMYLTGNSGFAIAAE